MRLGDIEFRYSETNKYHLIRWLPCEAGQKPSSIVIAFFYKDSEEFNMRTVGDRFFADPDAFEMGKCAMSFLKIVFDKEERGNND